LRTRVLTDNHCSISRVAELASWFTALILLQGCVTQTLEVASSEDLEQLEKVLEREADERTQEVTLKHARELVRTPIHFNGRVVSPDGEGISDVDVELTVFDRVIEPFHFPYFGYTALQMTQTDPNGYFELHGVEGVAVHVAVSKPGYRPVDLSHRTYQIEHVLPIAEDFPMPESDEAVLFTMKPRTAADQIREVATGAVLIPDHGALELSLTEINPRGVPAGEGHLALVCRRGDVSQKRYGWSCRVSSPGGGVQLRRLMDFDQAPESGYVPHLDLGFGADDEQWRDRLNEDVFLRLADGNYAFISLRIRTRGDYYVVAKGVVNTHGSRLID